MAAVQFYLLQHQPAPSPFSLRRISGSAPLPMCHQHFPFIKLRTSATSLFIATVGLPALPAKCFPEAGKPPES